MHLRLLTYNVQCRPLVDAVDNETRADEIARRIVASPADFDIVCLNEVFDEDARTKFIDGLKGKYPHHIARIGGDRAFTSSLTDTDGAGFVTAAIALQALSFGLVGAAARSQDSGLMLFSKFAFDMMPNPEDAGQPAVPAVKWQPYIKATGDDALSDKGALAVRLRLDGGDRFVIGLTHMQASDKDDETHADIRESQLSQAWTNMAALVNDGTQRHDFVLCGDTNIDGMMTQPDASDAGREWRQRLSAAMVGPADFWDAVAYEQSPHLWGAGMPGLTHPVDPGITVITSFGPRRYDYMLMRAGGGNRTLQHAYIDHALKVTAKNLSYTSDHWPLVADLLPDHHGPGTAAARGFPVICNEANPSFGHSAHLRPGEILWLCVLNSGSYEFAPFGCNMTLYGADDLSRPLAPYTELDRGAERGVKYLLPSAPIFVKLQAADRRARVDCSINIRRYLGTSLRDAIGLIRRQQEASQHRAGAPNSDYVCRLRNGAAVEDIVDARYFEFDVLRTTSGVPQQVRLRCNGTPGGAPMRLIIGREDPTDTLNAVAISDWGSEQLALSLALDAGHYFVAVQRRPGAGFPASEFMLSWDSNVSVLYWPEVYYNARGDGRVNPLAGLPPPNELLLKCTEETDSPFDIGDDDLSIELFADGKTIASVPTADLGGFSTNDMRVLDPWLDGPVTYVDRLTLKFIEEDVAVDDDGSLDILVTGRYRNGSRPVDMKKSADVVVVTERADFSGGTYTLTATLG